MQYYESEYRRLYCSEYYLPKQQPTVEGDFE